MSRYKIKRVPFIAEEYDSLARPWGLWDKRDKVYVDKFGQPSLDYYATSRAVAEMRRRDLNEYARQNDER